MIVLPATDSNADKGKNSCPGGKLKFPIHEDLQVMTTNFPASQFKRPGTWTTMGVF